MSVRDFLLILLGVFVGFLAPNFQRAITAYVAYPSGLEVVMKEFWSSSWEVLVTTLFFIVILGLVVYEMDSIRNARLRVKEKKAHEELVSAIGEIAKQVSEDSDLTP